MSLQADIIGLSAAYALLGVLLLLGVVRARLPWPVKATAIALTSALYVVAFFSTQGLLGWSSTDALPARFQLLWARNVDPDPGSDAPGAIHLWLEALDETNRPSGVPRAYRLPFSARLAEKVEAARVEIQNGHPQGGRAVDFGVGGGQAIPDQTAANPGRGAQPGGDPANGGPLDPELLGGDSRSVQFAPLPQASMPAKDSPQ